MIDAAKLQYYTTAAWLRGYASGLDEYQHKALIHKLTQAAELLDHVWGNYVNETQEEE